MQPKSAYCYMHRGDVAELDKEIYSCLKCRPGKHKSITYYIDNTSHKSDTKECHLDIRIEELPSNQIKNHAI